VDHLDGIHQRWQGLNDLLRSSSVKWLYEFFKCHQVFDIVFGFIQSVSQGEIKPLETEHKFVDVLLAFFFAFILLVFDQSCFNHVEIFAF
jgi:hypothetical protein